MQLLIAYDSNSTGNMCESRQPTERDRLLPSPVSERKSYKPTTNNYGRQRYIIAGASLLALVFSVHSIVPTSHQYHQGDKYKPKEQLSTLQQLTENALLMSALPSPHKSRHPKGKVNVVKDEKHNRHRNHNNNNEDNVFHCTSQVMIMRHCDKKRVKYFHHGKEKTIASDTKDKDGDRHCSAKGIDRSNYIATLFVDPENYQELVEGTSTSHHHKHKHEEHSAIADGIPPVPFIKSNGFEGKVASASSKTKPQFPTPLKLYALSDERGPASKPSRGHRNYREIETITPLSNKFHLDVDTRFGVKEEGELASDFFASLSKSVQRNVKKMKRKKFGYSARSEEEEDESNNDVLSTHLCNSGMTVVNWKHSQIPILARALGCGKNEGCPKRYKGRDFDTMWLLTFQYSLLLDDDKDGDEQIDTSVSVESLSKASFLLQEEKGSLRLGKEKSKKHHHGDGSWKITAELVNEGFEPL